MFPMRTLQELFGQDIAISQEMITAIEKWGAMYRGGAPWVDDLVESLQLEQGICREFANVCLNEMESSVSDERLDKIYQTAIRDLNENLQSGLAYGSFCIKPLGEDKVEYITQDRFIPLKFDSRGRLTRVSFIEVKKVADHDYFIRFETHTWDGQALTLNIQNQAFRSGDLLNIGKPIPLVTVPEWAGLPENVTYAGVQRPDFGYYRNPIKNTVDGSPCGVSVYNSAVNLIKKTDTQFGRLDWEFESAERAVHVDATALQPVKNIVTGQTEYRMPKSKERLYRGLNLSKANGDELYQEYSPALRDQNFINGLNAFLRRIEFNVCLSYGDLSDVNDVDKTATEAKIAKKRKYNMVKAIQSNLKDCLEDLIYALAFYNQLTQSGYEFMCNFKDSILVDEEEEREQDRKDVAMGVMRLEEYRAKWYGETLEEATKNLPEPALVEE